MTLLDSPPSSTIAAHQADAHFAANLAALRTTQPTLADRLAPTTTALATTADLTWTLARDGSLSALDSQNHWWAGCSVPLLAGRTLLKTLEPNPLHTCLLLPPHAGLFRAARERMGNVPAIIAIIPDDLTLQVILATGDFAHEIQQHRLWFAAGADWAADLKQLFDDYPGLSTPARFIKTKLLDDAAATSVITAAQTVFANVLTDRTRLLESIRAVDVSVATTPQRLLMIAGSSFRLWEDAGEMLIANLATGAGQFTLRRFDGDDPATSSPIALAMAARDADAIVAANVARADAPNLVHWGKPWITWITRPILPPHHAAGPHDALVLADPSWKSAARAAGWPEDRLAIASWPNASQPTTPTGSPHLALIADTAPIEPPANVLDMSSHLLLWEAITAELHENALEVDANPIRYLRDRAAAMNLDPDAIDQRGFLERLIFPAYTQGLARLLLRHQLPLRLHGRGWADLDEFAPAAVGPIENRTALHQAAFAAHALVYPWPVRHMHAIDSLGRPILHGTDRQTLLRSARNALTRATPPTILKSATSLADTIVGLLHGSAT